MMRYFLLNCLIGITLLWAGMSCGPEAETGPVFARFAQKTALVSSADTLRPGAGKPALTAGDAASLNYLTGKFDPAQRTDFVPVGKPYTDKPGMLLRKEAMEAFARMWADAQKAGVTLKIISSTRTFQQQKQIWEGKWARFAAETPGAEERARRILEYSAMPGASRHHWGTDVDLNDLNNPSFENGGKFEKAYIWLKNNAPRYGFCQPYTSKADGRRTGYNEEKWHWSYMPLAKPLLEQYSQAMRDELLTGFEGAATARSIGIVAQYALGINPECK